MVRQVLGPRLPALLPILVRGMRYSEMDVVLLRGDRDDDADDAEPDRESDIRPRFHKPRSHTIKHNGTCACTGYHYAPARPPVGQGVRRILY